MILTIPWQTLKSFDENVIPFFSPKPPFVRAPVHKIRFWKLDNPHIFSNAFENGTDFYDLVGFYFWRPFSEKRWKVVWRGIPARYINQLSMRVRSFSYPCNKDRTFHILYIIEKLKTCWIFYEIFLLHSNKINVNNYHRKCGIEENGGILLVFLNMGAAPSSDRFLNHAKTITWWNCSWWNIMYYCVLSTTWTIWICKGSPQNICTRLFGNFSQTSYCCCCIYSRASSRASSL